MSYWIISASVLTAAVILLRLIFRKHISRFIQYALWSVVLLRLLIPFSLLSSPISVANIFTASTPQAQVYIMPISQKPAAESDNVYVDKSGTVTDANSAGYAVLSKDGKTVIRYLARIGIEDILALIWLTGGIITGVWLLAVNIVFGVRLRRSRRRFDVHGCHLRVFISDFTASPCMFGLFRPAIYLTPKAAESSARHVIAHELCHYRHGDHFWTLMRCICITVWWWNPLVWAAAFMSRTDGELACDEAAIRLVGEDERLAYGKTLIDMIAVKKASSGLLCPATTMASDKQGIKERIEMIVKKPKEMISAVICVLLAAGLCVGCTFTGAKNQEPVPPAGDVYVAIECDTPVYRLCGDTKENGQIGACGGNRFASYLRRP